MATPKTSKSTPKVALVCDWLTVVGGAERVLKSVSDLYPDAPIYTSQYNPKGIDWFKDRDVRTGWMQKFPSGLRRFLAPLRVKYFRNLDLSGYDLIISVTGAEAKGVKKGNAKHLCFCHVPTQYYWQMYDEYIKNPGFGILNPLMRIGLKLMVKPLRKADYAAAQLPDQFITISDYAAEQIKTYYHRDAKIIFPPVSVENFLPETYKKTLESKKVKSELGDRAEKKSNQKNHKVTKKASARQGYIATPRQVTWKRLDLAVGACKKLRRPLTIIGEGPEHDRLVQLAAGADFIKFLPRMDQSELKNHLEKSAGYLFPSLEPFGIAPVESLAAGCPVIAFKDGGSRGYIKDGVNGVFFDAQTVDSLAAAIERFEEIPFDESVVIESSLKFAEPRFQSEIRTAAKSILKKKL